MVGPDKRDISGNRRMRCPTPYPLRRGNTEGMRGESSSNTAEGDVPENLGEDVEMTAMISALTQPQHDEIETLEGSAESQGVQGRVEMDSEEIPGLDKGRNQATKRKWDDSEGQGGKKGGPDGIKRLTKKTIFQLEHGVIIELEDEEEEEEEGVPIVQEFPPIPQSFVAENRKMEITEERGAEKGTLEVQENVTKTIDTTSSKLIVIEVPPDSTSVQEPDVVTELTETNFYESLALQQIQEGQTQTTLGTLTSSNKETEKDVSVSTLMTFPLSVSSIKELFSPETTLPSTSHSQDASKSTYSCRARTKTPRPDILLNTAETSVLFGPDSFGAPPSLRSEVSFRNELSNLESVRGESSKYTFDFHSSFQQSATDMIGLNISDSSAQEKSTLESGFLSDRVKSISSPLTIPSAISENVKKTEEMSEIEVSKATRKNQTKEMKQSLSESSTSTKTGTESIASNPQDVLSSSKQRGTVESTAGPSSGTHEQKCPQEPSTSSSQDEDATLLAVKMFEISLQDMIKTLGPIESAEELGASRTDISNRPWFHRPILVGTWVAMQIDSEWYPGTVEEVNFPNVTVDLMERGPERHLFYWPESGNRRELHQRYLLSILENPPYLTSNGMWAIADYPFIDFLCHDTWT